MARTSSTLRNLRLLAMSQPPGSLRELLEHAPVARPQLLDRRRHRFATDAYVRRRDYQRVPADGDLERRVGRNAHGLHERLVDHQCLAVSVLLEGFDHNHLVITTL